MTDSELFRRIDAYLDAVPRFAVRTEQIGPFTLFANEGHGWRYYARPTPGETAFSREEVDAVLERQRALDQPLEFEWMVDVSPGVGPACEQAGLAVHDMPLMHLPREQLRDATPPPGSAIAFATPDDDLAMFTAVAVVGFGVHGTGRGAGGHDEVASAARAIDANTVEFTRGRIERGLTVVAVATIEGAPVATGSHQPIDAVTEIVGVACIPEFRRRGFGAAVAGALARDAFDRGVTTVFLSADDDDVARVYARLGFVEIGRMGAAAPP